MAWNYHSAAKLTIDIEQGNNDNILTRLYKLGKTLKYKWAYKKLSMNKFQVCSFQLHIFPWRIRKTPVHTAGVLESLLRDAM